MNDRTRKIVSFTDGQWGFFLSLLIIGIPAGIWVLLPGPGSSREAARASMSKNNLKQIGIAMHNYHDKFDVFPPAMMVNESGYEMHGWPALLLPYIEQTALHSTIDFEQPFDDPANQSVMNVDIQVYLNPMVERPPGAVAELHYALNSHVFGPNNSLKFGNIADGFSNTFLGGEIAEGFRPWNNPRHTRDPALGFNAGPLTFGSPYYGTSKYRGVQMLFMDGSVQYIDDSIDPKVLEALSTPAAGDDPGSRW
ncbi:MAG TPA: DUF1559 domain-containing protein [Planctomycetaceae bacterium]|nr:DUF1559 domain-containing protein [Planctomycetaceae bacterium]